MCLSWYGHVIRGDENSIAKIGLSVEINMKPPEVRLKKRRFDKFEDGLRTYQFHPGQAYD